jgi:hypothetical protein
MTMPSIDYLRILKNAWKITWRHPYLWWYGLFVALAGGLGNFNFNFDQKQFDDGWQKYGDQAQTFFADHITLVAGIVSFLIIGGIIFIPLGLVGRGALISSVKTILKGEASDYRMGFGEGRKYLGKLFLLGLALIFLILACLTILSIPVIFLIANKSYVLGITLGITAILIFIPILVLTTYLRVYGQLYIVLGKIGVRAAIEQATNLFQKNLPASLIMGLLFLPIGLAFVAAVLALLLPLGLFFGPLALVAYFAVGKIGAAVAIGLGIFIFLLGVLALRAVYEVFAQTVWTLFFHEIASPKVEEHVHQVIEELEKEEKALPEAEPAKTAMMEK